MIKVLYLPLNQGDVVQEGMYDAFRAVGADLHIFDYFNIYLNKGKKQGNVRQDLINLARKIKPDLVFLQIQHTTIIDSTTVSKIKQINPKCIIVNWTSDARVYVPKTYRKIALVSDYNFIPSTGQIDLFEKEIGKKVHYLQIGYSPRLYFPEEKKRNKFAYDISFIANVNRKENYPGTSEREEAVKLLRKKFGNRFGLFGNGWPISLNPNCSLDQKKVGLVYRNSFAVLSISHFNNINHYFSDRLLMCMASGRPTICFNYPGYESHFTNNCDLVIANSIQEIGEKIDWLLSNPDMANYIGQSGAAKVAAEHTYLSRVKELFSIIGIE